MRKDGKRKRTTIGGKALNVAPAERIGKRKGKGKRKDGKRPRVPWKDAHRLHSRSWTPFLRVAALLLRRTGSPLDRILQL